MVFWRLKWCNLRRKVAGNNKYSEFIEIQWKMGKWRKKAKISRKNVNELNQYAAAIDGNVRKIVGNW